MNLRVIFKNQDTLLLWCLSRFVVKHKSTNPSVDQLIGAYTCVFIFIRQYLCEFLWIHVKLNAPVMQYSCKETHHECEYYSMIQRGWNIFFCVFVL